MARGITSKYLVSANAGEWSPLLDARYDLEKYSNACRQLQNAIILPYGGFKRRAGTEYIAEVKSSAAKCRLIDFQFSTTTTFILELGNEYIRFYSNGAQVESGGSPYEISSPYLTAELFEMQWAQINDVMYLVHPNHPPQKLARVTDTNWTLTEVQFDLPPFLDENLTTTTITPSGTTGNITLTASSALFEAGHVGSYWRIGHRREATFVERGITANGSTTSIRTSTNLTLRTTGTWNATVTVQVSKDGSTGWETIASYDSVDDRNVNADIENSENQYFRITVVNYSSHSGTPTPRAILEVGDDFVYGYAKVTGFTSSTVVDATVVNEFHANTASDIWSEGAWSEVRGFPRTVTIYQQRMMYAGTTYQPQTVWGTVTGDYENFRAGTNDDDGFSYTLGATERNAIQWMVAQRDLLIGTSGGEWSLASGSFENPLSPTNVLVKRQSTYGSQDLRATLVNEVVLFTQRQGRKVREMVFSFERDGFVAADLTLLSEHITAGGIVDTAYQQQDNSIFWCITANGKLLGMTYEREQNVIGWHRHETDGEFESVATSYGAGSDEVWVIVKRTINGSTKRYVERINPVAWTAKEDAFYVDCGLSYNGSATTTLSGLGHLEGKTVQILGDGAVIPDRVVTSGSITLPRAVTKAHVGLKFETIYQPMRIDMDSIAGVTQGETKRIRELVVRVNNTLGLSYSDGEGTFDRLSFRDTSDPMDASPPLFTGDKVIELEGGYEFEGDFILKQDQPLPWTFLGVVVKYQITGR